MNKKSINFLEMKTLKVVFTVLALFMASKAALAGGGVDPTTKFAYQVHAIKGTEKFRLAFENKSKQRVSIKILDANGSLVFSEIQRDASKMNKNYDLSQIGKGKYVVVIRSGKFEVKEELTIGDVEVPNFEAVIAAYAAKKNTVRVLFKNPSNEVYMIVRDRAGNLVYENTIEGYQNYHALYNLNELAKGDYSITLRSNNQSITKDYEVK